MVAIAKTKDALNEHRKLLARFPPPVQHSNLCSGSNRNRCKEAYEELWWKHVGKALLDPNLPVRFWKVPDVLDGIRCNNMGEGCIEKTWASIKGSPVLEMDEQIIREALDKLRRTA
jgi:hypothetical protein